MTIFNENLNLLKEEIAYITDMMDKSNCITLHLFFSDVLLYKMTDLTLMQLNETRAPFNMIPEFTPEMLSSNDGSNGRPAYAAVDDLVYDLSLIPSWAGGTHFGVSAGKDLTKEFHSCHNNNKKVLNKLKVLGKLKP